ncbi:heptaprenyl diphosphate synthase component 1 [Kurthia senegalensis]|uniref:heptaprenyl diphosphate synthase component 1 n=1 Tax=Kurthia senegalensis TaxID=1033740 RepID=UPI00028850A5|nr:heptaprenyl diphosphate synthase component 1 [Kurthia senegalensis]
MIATTIKQKVAQFKQNIFTKLHHRTLLEYTGQPVVSDDEIMYLLLPFLNGEKSNDSTLLAAEAIAMNMAALNTHDLIEEHDATSKSQQLTVLAGDLYSGMYYATLAQVGDVLLIRSITEAVATISEEKTKFYETSHVQLQDALHALEVIETESIQKFFEHFAFEQYSVFARYGLLIQRLAKELDSCKTDEQTRFISAFNEDGLEAKLRNELQTLATTYEKVVSTSPLLHDDVKNCIVSRIQTHVNN